VGFLGVRGAGQVYCKNSLRFARCFNGCKISINSGKKLVGNA